MRSNPDVVCEGCEATEKEEFARDIGWRSTTCADGEHHMLCPTCLDNDCDRGEP